MKAKNPMEISTLQTILGMALGAASFLSGIILWYKGAIEKRYAAERDFAHLRRNQEQMGNGIAQLAKEQDDRFDRMELELAQIKSALVAMMAKSGADLSGIFRHKKGE